MNRQYAEHWDKFSKDYNLPSVKHLGDEWGDAAPIVEEFIKPYLHGGAAKVLEIGPGGGRFTNELIKFVGVDNVEVADCSGAMLDRCSARFGAKLKTYLTDGRTLDAIKPTDPYDFVFSYDVFCHIDLFDIRRILIQLRTLIKPGATLVIHHSELGTTFGYENWINLREMFKGDDSAGSFSVNSAAMMRVVMRNAGYAVETQVPVRAGRDTVTVAKV
jgi:SAM-dependent methyltransferase